MPRESNYNLFRLLLKIRIFIHTLNEHMHFNCDLFFCVSPTSPKILVVWYTWIHMTWKTLSCLCIHQFPRPHCSVNSFVNFFLNYIRCLQVLQPCHCPCVLGPCICLVEAHFQIHISLYLLVLLWQKQLYYTTKLLSLIETEQYVLNIEPNSLCLAHIVLFQ